MNVAEPRLNSPGRTNAASTTNEACTLAFHAHQHGSGVVVVSNLRTDDLRTASTPGLLNARFRVSVARPGLSAIDDLPDVSGRYEVREDAVLFIPYFPFEAGMSYRAAFDLRGLRSGSGEVLEIKFSPPPLASVLQRTAVTSIFPSADRLPENVLRFYVCFANAMQRGHSEHHVVLLGPDGTPAPDVLYRPPVELWDKRMRCLTVLLDPGRLKRMVGPNRELGPPLTAGQAYTLEIGAAMIDLSGRRLLGPFHKHFEVDAAVRQRVALDQWTVVAPAALSFQPLVLAFAQPMDWALLAESIFVTTTGGRAINGQIFIEQDETRWRFAPASRWQAGAYHVHIESGLEDVCGNSCMAAFDRPMRSGRDLRYEAARGSINFHVS